MSTNASGRVRARPRNYDERRGGAADAWSGHRLLAAGHAWAHLSLLARSTLLLATVTVLAAGGWWANGQRAASVRRLGAVLWFLAVAAVAGFAEVVADQVLHQSHGLQHVTSGLAATAAGVLLWRLRVSGLQQVAVLVSPLAPDTALFRFRAGHRHRCSRGPAVVALPV